VRADDVRAEASAQTRDCGTLDEIGSRRDLDGRALDVPAAERTSERVLGRGRLKQQASAHPTHERPLAGGQGLDGWPWTAEPSRSKDVKGDHDRRPRIPPSRSEHAGPARTCERP
jgi:hypothetical protein